MEIIIIILLILLNGLFAMSEIALISARRSNLTARAKQGNKAAAKALQLAQDPDRFLSKIQIGIKIGRASCREECRSRWSPYH